MQGYLFCQKFDILGLAYYIKGISMPDCLTFHAKYRKFLALTQKIKSQAQQTVAHS